MARKTDAKLVMLAHSLAKVELYANYLATYLNILSRTPFVDKIHLYDLMCGEGIYSDGSKGSPIVAMEKIKAHYFSNNKTSPDLEVWFNDKDESEIEKNKFKIDRVEEYCNKIFRPQNVNVSFTKKDYQLLYPEVINRISTLNQNERILMFLDPYGYKEIKPAQLKEFLKCGKSELLLFIPISFMSRFANKSISLDEFPGGRALEEFLNELLIEKGIKKFSTNPLIFIEELKELFRTYMKSMNVFVDTFTIERDEQNLYSLFFFTPHIKGFEAMLNTKWKLDEARGKGFRLNFDQQALFNDVEITGYESELESFIKSGSIKTNANVYLFGLEKGFLPRHSTEIMRKWQNTSVKFKVYNEDGSEAHKGAFYIKYENYKHNPKRIVKFVFE